MYWLMAHVGKFRISYLGVVIITLLIKRQIIQGSWVNELFKATMKLSNESMSSFNVNQLHECLQISCRQAHCRLERSTAVSSRTSELFKGVERICVNY